MSGSPWYPSPGGPGDPPPPGWQPPSESPPPLWGPAPGGPPPAGPPGGSPGWAPGMLGAAHKPGAMPLRPLGLGDLYDAAFRIIRFNPRATVGSSVLVAAVAMALPVLVTAVVTLAVGLSAESSGGDTADELGSLTALGALGLGSALQYVGLIFVTGMIAHVTAAAAIGRRLTLGEAWAATRGSRWRLVGITVLIGLLWLVLLLGYVLMSVVVLVATSSWELPLAWFVVTGPAVVALGCWLWIRLTYLAVPALMVERTGVFAGLGRAYALTRRQFWRTFGIGLLTLVVTSVAAQILTVPFAIVGSVLSVAISDPEVALLLMVVVNALGTVVSTAFVAPLTAAVASLQYLDQRIRKEAYDIELMTQAGITAP
ncbi:hypothetical protein [Nocardioides soli]|uniref:Glycerophosphoryl diester phosphodiesterase membrane domain-containing protein n=1 Tax=Nocardioides soli TaxID=1036020 RepID=A0A7W4VUJ7_9ACTN|nr:hypothetical protein [Nocardioides soli]MBB3042051.1 hypothetical protein [Nocardioides soli]